MIAHDAHAQVAPSAVADVLSTIARAMVADDDAPVRIGTVTLLPHQREGANRLRRIMQRHGGALLCDAVGVGKTYVALAVAQRFSETLIVAPAVLRDMWMRAVAAAGITASVVSVESLGRKRAVSCSAPLVIVDEAHHLRNSATRRYDAAARLCASAQTLLLSATPLHNRRSDVAALVALFAGVRAHAWTDEELASVIVRRDQSDVALHRMPRVEHAPAYALGARADGTLDALIALPPPVPPSDGVDAAALVTHSLIRQWASSNAALTGAIRRRIARGHALLAALADGRYPTRSELREWICTEDAVQLAFTQLLSTSPATDPTLHSALERHVEALGAVLRRAEADVAADRERADHVREICARHAPDRVVAFTCYEETAEMVYRALRHRVRTVLLTSRGGIVAGGRISRGEVLDHFARDDGAQRAAECERIDLLVTTDLLSEGVDLLAASVAIHLDLPWTAARLEQRVGRLARVGSRHPVVTTYTLRPSPRAESILRAAEIVRRKASLATQLLAAQNASAASPLAAAPVDTDGAQRSEVECAEEIQRLLRRCLRRDPSPRPGIPTAQLAAETQQALVACLIDGEPRLLVVTNGGVDASPRTALCVLELALSDPSAAEHVCVHDAARALHAARAWHAARTAAVDAGVELPMNDRRTRAAFRGRRRAIGTLDGAVSSSPFVRRDSVAARAAALRALAAQPATVGRERALFGDAPALDVPAAHPGRPLELAPPQSSFRVVALLLFAPPAPPG